MTDSEKSVGTGCEQCRTAAEAATLWVDREFGSHKAFYDFVKFDLCSIYATLGAIERAHDQIAAYLDGPGATAGPEELRRVLGALIEEKGPLSLAAIRCHPGRPSGSSSTDPATQREFIARYETACRRGASKIQAGHLVGLDYRTLERWKKQHQQEASSAAE